MKKNILFCPNSRFSDVLQNQKKKNHKLNFLLESILKSNKIPKRYSTLKEATETIGHRLTGSENGAKAEEYTYNKFKEYGFEDVEYQTFEVEAWARDSVSLEIDDEPTESSYFGAFPGKGRSYRRNSGYG